jgi:4-amino-4-deoxy-L-arabinose transferase-like glycosyltransferase
MMATYALLKEIRVSTGLALFGGLVVAFSPVYFALSFTFMTDVPFTAIATASCWLLLRGLRKDSWMEIVAGLILATAAILIRQVGLAIPLAFGLAYIAKRGPSIKNSIAAIVPAATTFAIQFAYQKWLLWSGHIPINFGKQIRTLDMQLHQDWTAILRDGMTITVYAFLYLGLFLFPFLLVATRLPRARRGAVLILTACVSTAVTAVLSTHGKLMPVHGIVLSTAGIGIDAGPIGGPGQFWTMVTFLSVMGAILLLWVLVTTILFLIRLFKQHQLDQGYVQIFCLGLIIIGFSPLALLGLTIDGFFDRYLIMFLPPLIVVTASWTGAAPDETLKLNANLTTLMAIIVLLAMARFSVLAIHDWLSWHRVLWTAVNNLMDEKNLSPERIDGGFEFNGWYYYHNTPNPEGGRSYIVSDEYIVAPFLHNGYVALKQYPVDRWLPWGRADIIVQSRP